ncbi:hypothetical protein ACOSZF_21660 [Cytobacillus firmus]|uniref:hypothetical protein n=1 Tax=Cytobacillus TaxID=2675230 RepID=UPI0018CF1BBA|nr:MULTISPECIES: hypothetical protein [Cytobacillus]MBG9656082.1 hypothetical protein [Cytobacillus firmus]MDK7664376.1 hypothetical protein [Cytobacillus oceanisediminis]MED1907845.1 hypothetical protein [Cytobacillus firmus]
MKCPICQSSSKVKDVREKRRDSKTRKRVCEKGHSFLSYEVSEERLAELLDYEKAFFKMQELLEKYDQ